MLYVYEIKPNVYITIYTTPNGKLYINGNKSLLPADIIKKRLKFSLIYKVKINLNEKELKLLTNKILTKNGLDIKMIKKIIREINKQKNNQILQTKKLNKNLFKPYLHRKLKTLEYFFN